MTEEMGYLDGGSNTLLEALQKDLEQRGVEINLGAKVSRVVHEDHKVAGIEIGDVKKDFDAVISTIPLPFVPKLLPDIKESYLKRYRSVDNIGVVCVLFKLKQPVTENFWLNINDERMAIPGIIEFSNLRPLETNLVYVPFYLPHDHEKNNQSDAEFIDEARQYLKYINPKLNEGEFIDSFVSRYRFAQPICPPGFLDRLPPIKTYIDGLYVADTSYYYPEDRSISESVRLGREIAEMVAP